MENYFIPNRCVFNVLVLKPFAGLNEGDRLEMVISKMTTGKVCCYSTEEFKGHSRYMVFEDEDEICEHLQGEAVDATGRDVRMVLSAVPRLFERQAQIREARRRALDEMAKVDQELGLHR